MSTYNILLGTSTTNMPNGNINTTPFLSHKFPPTLPPPPPPSKSTMSYSSFLVHQNSPILINNLTDQIPHSSKTITISPTTTAMRDGDLDLCLTNTFVPLVESASYDISFETLNVTTFAPTFDIRD